MFDRPIPNRYLLLLFIFLLLPAIACGGSNPVEATPTPPPATATLPPTPSPLPPTATPTREPDVPTPVPTREVTTADLQAGTVQIFAQVENRGQLQTMWTGSGTIISPDGYILTNAHVASPTSPGLAVLYNDLDLLFSEDPDALVIGIVQSADRPAVAMYLAEVVAADGPLDLALLQITATAAGDPVDPANLNLPYVALGDSSQVQLGDEIRVLGFPGAGGETITFTRGDVAGFESQEQVGERAWIKTDTTISPGNSGGLGANALGEIIGVPSYVLEAVGGSINRLRAINYALPLLEAAQAGQTYQSPYVVTASGDEQMQFTTWAEDFSETDSCALGPLTTYPDNTILVTAVFSYKGMQAGEQFIEAWYQDDELVLFNISTWEKEERGTCFATYLHNGGDPMPPGTYSVELMVGADLLKIGAAETTVGETAVAGSVMLEGTITDADTGKSVSGAGIILLLPGTDLDAWRDDPDYDAVFDYAETDNLGQYAILSPLERGNSYPAVVVADGYHPTDGYVNVDADDPATLIIDVQLSK